MNDSKINIAIRNKNIKKRKVILTSFGIFLTINITVIAIILIAENLIDIRLRSMYPYICIGLAVHTVFAASVRIRRISGLPRMRALWRFVTIILLAMVTSMLIAGACIAAVSSNKSDGLCGNDEFDTSFPYIKEPVY